MKSRLKIYYLIVVITVTCFFITVPEISVKFKFKQFNRYSNRRRHYSG